MSNASDNFENDLAKLFFQGVAWANVADDAASSPVENWWFSLHTSSPGESGNQSSNEVSTSAHNTYARKSAPRSEEGFDVTGGVASPAANIDFDEGASGTGGSAGFFGLGNSQSSTGRLQVFGAISPSLVLGAGSIPRLKSTTTITIS
jgi:hypothetical protein